MKPIRCMLGIHRWEVVGARSVFGIDTIAGYKCSRCSRVQWYFVCAGMRYRIPTPPPETLTRDYLLGLLDIVRHSGSFSGIGRGYCVCLPPKKDFVVENGIRREIERRRTA